MIVGPGQAGDSPMFPVVMEAVRVPRLGGGPPRTRPEAVLGDKAYSSRANRSLLRSRGIKTVIPEPSDQIRHRKRRGSRGGRPVNFDSNIYKGRNTVERSFSLFKQWRAIATRYDKLALTYRAGDVLYAVVIWAYAGAYLGWGGRLRPHCGKQRHSGCPWQKRRPDLYAQTHP